MFARARIDKIGGGKLDLAVALLDQNTGDAAPCELAGQRQADGPAAGNEHRRALRTLVSRI